MNGLTLTDSVLTLGGVVMNNPGLESYQLFGSESADTFDASAWTTLKDGQWHHVVFTMPGSAQDSIQSAAMYLDGVAVTASTTMATGPQNAKSGVFLGNTSTTGWSGSPDRQS